MTDITGGTGVTDMTGRRAASFADQLRQRREGAGLTPNAISALERGERTHPYPQTVRALAEALGLSAPERAALAASVPRRGVGRQAPPPEPSRPEPPQSERPPVAGAAELPAVPSRLIGRTRELDSLSDFVREGARLITLTGPGGVGKTRLAIELAGCLAGAFPDGVVFVGLAPLTDPALVIPTIAFTLGLRETGSLSLRETLHDHLRERRLLLVLDNFEQVAEAATEVVALLASAGHLVALVTSRASLRVRGEQEYPVPPLELPDLTQVPRVQEVAGSPAVDLFVERARAVAPGFTLSRTNALAVAAIARRLDGLPLALELAAARMRLLDPTTLLARLDPVLPLLSHGPRDLPERHRTMPGAIQWSYDLLTPAQQALFRRLAVFRGGWTLEAAERVGTGDAVASEDVLDLLSDLLEQSLIAVGSGEGTRYRMLEPIRQYAQGLLEASGEVEAVRDRHAAFSAALAGRAVRELRGPEQVSWLARLDQEHDNLRAALDWLVQRRDLATASRLGFSLWLFWWMRGHFTEGRRWMGLVLAQDPEPPDGAWALLVAGVLAYGQGDYEAASPVIEESLVLFGDSGDEHGLALATAMAGLIALGREQYEPAVALLDEGVQRCLRVGDKWAAAMQLTYSAVIPLRLGDSRRAAQLTEQALELARELGDRVSTYASLYNLACLAQAHGDHARSTHLFIEGLDLSVEMGDRGNTAYCLEGLAGLAAEQGDGERAAQLWAAAEALLATVEAAVYAHTPDRSRRAEAIAGARTKMDERAWERAWEQGRSLSWEQAVEQARAPATPRPSR